MSVKTGIIYKITNTVNGRCYIGQTVKPIQVRWRLHKWYAKRGHGWALQRAIRKYGPDAFKVEVIAESLEPFLDTLEIFFIRLFMSRTEHNGYNMTPGGDGVGSGKNNPNYGKKLSPERCAMISAVWKGKKKPPFSPEWCAHIAAGNRGKKLSPESIAKRTESIRGKQKNKKKNPTSRFLGVYWDKWHRKFRAIITVNDDQKRLGSFTAEIEAARAYDVAALEHYGPDARLNFPLGGTLPLAA